MIPTYSKKININMAPANLRKEGFAYDLSLAPGILAVSSQIKTNLLSDYVVMGEIAFDGASTD